MSLLHHHSLLAYPTTAAFDPLSITWDYYNQSTIVFNGISDYVDSGIKNAYARLDYWHIWFKSTIADGQPSAIKVFWGGRTATTATVVSEEILTTGAVRCLDANVSRPSVSPNLFANGAIASTVFHYYRNNVNIIIEINGVAWMTSADLTKPTAQTTINISYGARNQAGTQAAFWAGTSKGIYVWGGASDLTAQQILNMNTYMTNL